MSNLIFACWRDASRALDKASILRVADRISVDLGLPGGHAFAAGPGLALCLTRPVGAAAIEGLSARVGAFTGAWPGWPEPGSPAPEGSFALVRGSEDRVEACTDFVASRTLWYVFDEDRFFVSTSLRALICLMGGWEFNPRAHAWFLAGGTLGHEDAWDRRIRRLPADGRAVLDRRAWTLEIRSGAVEFKAEEMPDDAWASTLLGALKGAVQAFDFRTRPWILPLSGGYDSRFILAALHESGLRLPAVTWGLAASRGEKDNDAYLAPLVAAHAGLPHEYFETDFTGVQPAAAVVDDFLAASGGTTDMLFPYLDRLHAWSTFARRGYAGIVRGDQGFGFYPRKERHAQHVVGLTLLSQAVGPEDAEAIAGGELQVPSGFELRPGETLATYADRLYHAFGMPVGLAALNDVKVPFVEVAAPFLARPVQALLRAMPDRHRLDRALYRKVVEAYCPRLPYATQGADDDRSQFMRTALFRGWISEELESGFCQRALPSGLRAKLWAAARQPGAGVSLPRAWRGALKRTVPQAWVQALRGLSAPPVPGLGKLAYRAALASRMAALLDADARFLRQAP